MPELGPERDSACQSGVLDENGRGARAQISDRNKVREPYRQPKAQLATMERGDESAEDFNVVKGFEEEGQEERPLRAGRRLPWNGKAPGGGSVSEIVDLPLLCFFPGEVRTEVKDLAA